MKKRLNNWQKSKLFVLITVALQAVIVLGIYFFIFVPKTNTDNLSSALETITPTTERFSQKKIVGEVNGDLLKYRSDKLGIEFQVPNIKDFKFLNEKVDNKTDSRVKDVALNYCLTVDSDNLGPVVCPKNLFALSSFSRTTGPKRGFEFNDLTSFSETTAGYTVHRTFVDGSLEVSITNAKYLKNINGISILKVLGESEYSEMQQQKFSIFGHPLEGFIGAIVNLPNNPEYSGFNMTMKLTDTLTEKVFDQILDSIKIVN